MSTALDVYMKMAGITDADLAAMIGRDRSMVSKLRRGVLRPTLETAASIEEATKGSVTIYAWLPTPATEPPPPFRNPPRRTVETAPGKAAA